MGLVVSMSPEPPTFSSFCVAALSLILAFCSIPSNGEDDYYLGGNSTANPPLPLVRQNASPLRPSIAVIVGVLTTVFSATFLFLLYAKHCKRSGGGGGGGHPRSSIMASSAPGREESGIDRSVIESLPVFRFGSLRGEKDGLECAVCLTPFEPPEVLRLLPKCKHAFHVECIDTWLDAHSTCPLCRCRVDPEDILLVGDPTALLGSSAAQSKGGRDGEDEQKQHVVVDINEGGTNNDRMESRRVSGRHSSAGEKGTSGFLQLLHLQHKKHAHASAGDGGCSQDASLASYRRSWDSAGQRKKSESIVTVGCFELGPRNDTLLLAEDKTAAATARSSSTGRRLEHRIIVSGAGGPPSSTIRMIRGGGGSNNGQRQRWSDVQPSDVLYLRSEMIISDRGGAAGEEDGTRIINTRSVSEITGLSRFPVRRERSESEVHSPGGGSMANHGQQGTRQRDTTATSAGAGGGTGGGGGGGMSRWLRG